jgi:hypothetical protein
MPITKENNEINQFLVKAKIVTYASGSDEYAVTSALQHAHQLEFSDGNLLYRDIYYGGLHFIGMETVFQNGKPVWGMSYYGGVLPSSDDLHIAGMPPVLKAALREVPLEAPFRGPESYKMNRYSYENEFQGNLFSFHGTEIIHIQEQTIYRLHYAGGKVE